MKTIVKLQFLVFFMILFQVRIMAQTYTYNGNQVLPPSPTAAWYEYPYASTLQGGASTLIEAVRISEQSIQRNQLSSFYRSNKMVSGNPFIVELVPRIY